MKKAIIGFGAGLLFGAGGGYFLTKRKYEKEISECVERFESRLGELQDRIDALEGKNVKKVEVSEEQVNDPNQRVIDISSGGEKKTMTVNVVKPDDRTLGVRKVEQPFPYDNLPEEEDETDTDLIKTSMRGIDTPYEIEENEYGNLYPSIRTETLILWDDGVITEDDAYTIIDNPQYILGDILEVFKVRSSKEFICIRNERSGCDYRVEKRHETYEEVNY